MQAVAHTMPPPGRGQRRATGLFFALLFQVALITALVVGLDIKVWPKPDPGIETRFIPTKTVVPLPPPPVGEHWVEPTRVPLPNPPVWDNDRGDENRIHPDQGPVYRPGPADHGPVSIAATHTVPAYPPLYARLGSEGTVVLRLTISPQGFVSDAVVIRSSGIAGLDEVARMWVLQHWRYQPAIRGGVAAPGTATVGVEFNLKNPG